MASWKRVLDLRSLTVGWTAAAAILVGVAGSASALDGVPLSTGEGEAAEPSQNGCPALTQIKYPFLSCRRDDYGNVVLVSEGGVVSSPGHMPEQDRFVAGDGYWGPDR